MLPYLTKINTTIILYEKFDHLPRIRTSLLLYLCEDGWPLPSPSSSPSPCSGGLTSPVVSDELGGEAPLLTSGCLNRPEVEVVEPVVT